MVSYDSTRSGLSEKQKNWVLRAQKVWKFQTISASKGWKSKKILKLKNLKITKAGMARKARKAQKAQKIRKAWKAWKAKKIFQKNKIILLE